MIAGVAASACLALGALAGGDVGFVADDRIEAGRLAFLVELDGAEQVAVIGQGDGVHARRLGVGHQFGQAVGAVEQAVMTVTMKMNKRTFRHEEVHHKDTKVTANAIHQKANRLKNQRQ